MWEEVYVPIVGRKKKFGKWIVNRGEFSRFSFAKEGKFKIFSSQFTIFPTLHGNLT